MSAANGKKAEEAGEPTEVVVSNNIQELKAEKEKKEEKPKVKPSQLLHLFRFASPCDILLMLLGTMAAIIHGCALPIFTLYFGDLADGFILEAISTNISTIVSDQIANGTARLVSEGAMAIGSGMGMESVSIDCDSTFQFLMGGSYTPPTTITGLIQSVNNTRLADAECLLGDAFIANINTFTYVFVGIAVGVWLVGMTQISTFQFTSERQVHRIRLSYYRAIMRQDIAWFDENPTGALVNRLSDDIDKIYTGIGDKLAILIQWLTSFFAGFACAFSQDWRLTLLLLAFTPLMAISGGFLAKVTSAFTSKEQSKYADAGAVAEEVLSSIRTIYAFGGEAKETTRYDGKLKQALNLGAKKGTLVGISLGLVFFFLFSIYAVGFGFGGYLVAEQGATGGTILTVFFCVVIAAFSLGQASPNVEAVFTAAGAASTVYETIDRIPPIDSSSDEGARPEKLTPTIELKNVDFTYPSRPDVQVMHDVSLKANVGQTVALVGSSGCGKSTVVQLIQRFYDVDSGEVLVGGMNVKDLNLKWLRGKIGVVSQEPVLFNTTIVENIRYGKEDATLEEITEAAKKANAHDFIIDLPNGYDTNVGEGGAQLSGGQKQRVAIARALISDPRILLLDEATSALDAESEAVVQEALDKAREGRTTIIIAHRLSTIQNADYICAINEGRVVEVGTHAQLMEKKGVYCDLVNAQSFGTDELFIESKSLGRLYSRKESESQHQPSQLARQHSLQRQTSGDKKKTKQDVVMELSLKKKQEEWDKEIPDVPLFRVLALNAKEWWLIILGVLGSAVNGSIFPIFAIIFGEILAVFSRPTGAEILDGIGFWAGLYVVLGFVSGLAIFFKTFSFTVAGEKLTYRLRSRLFHGFLRQEIGWHDDERNSTGALTTRLAHDAAQVQGATGSRVGTLLESFVSLFLTLIIAFVFSWLVTLVILGVVPLIIIAGSFQVQIFTRHATKIKKNLENAGKLAVDSIDNIRTVASLTIEEKFTSQYTDEVTRPYKSSIRIHPVTYGFTYSFSQAIIFFMYAIVFRFGGFVVTRDPDSILHVDFEDVFIVFMAIIFGAISVGQASAFAPNYAKAKLSANRIFALLDRKPIIDNFSEEGQELEKVSGAVSLDTVNFSYPTRPEVPVLQGLSVSLEPGKSLALVGPSGCGKSTIVSLIERFYDPSSGMVKLEGVDIRDLKINWLRSQIGIVSQEPVLFDASIAENIRYGALFREVTDDEVTAVAKAANIHSFIETLPQGYDTNVGAKGTQLSGGQKQRIAIARALIRDPKVLLLDEATSALDTESEKVVQEALDKAREGRTTIIIAHRLSTVYSADTIAVIKGGKVLESGSHTQLLASKGLYYKLNKFQMVKETAEDEQ